MKKIILCILLLSLISCGRAEEPREEVSSIVSVIPTESVSEDVSASGTTEITSYQNTWSYTTQTEGPTHSGPESADAYDLDLSVLTVRWGMPVEGSRYEQLFHTVTHEPGNAQTVPMGMTCVEVEVVKVWNERYGDINVPYREFSDMTHLWVDDRTLSMIPKGGLAIVFPVFLDANPAPGEDFDRVFDYLFLGAVPGFTVKEYAYECRSNVFPIAEGRIQIQKTQTEQWSPTVESLLTYNQLLDRDNSAIPRFADGMTLEEFERLVASLID